MSLPIDLLSIPLDGTSSSSLTLRILDSGPPNSHRNAYTAPKRICSAM